MIPIEHDRDLIETRSAVEVGGFRRDKIPETIIETIQGKLKSAVSRFERMHIGPLQQWIGHLRSHDDFAVAFLHIAFQIVGDRFVEAHDARFHDIGGCRVHGFPGQPVRGGPGEVPVGEFRYAAPHAREHRCRSGIERRAHTRMGIAPRGFRALGRPAHEVRQGIGVRERPPSVAVGIPNNQQCTAIELRAHAVLGTGAIKVHAARIVPAVQDAAEYSGTEEHGQDHRNGHQGEKQFRAAPRAPARPWLRGWRYAPGAFTGHLRLKFDELGLPLCRARLIVAECRHFSNLLIAAMAVGFWACPAINAECRLGNIRTFQGPRRMAIAES
jgi:hypothetical protein